MAKKRTRLLPLRIDGVGVAILISTYFCSGQAFQVVAASALPSFVQTIERRHGFGGQISHFSSIVMNVLLDGKHERGVIRTRK